MMQLRSALSLKTVSQGFAIATAAVALCACETLFNPLPPGTPPPDVIVSEIKDVHTLPNPDKAVNTMATSLTIELVRDARPFVRLEAANADAGLGERLMKSLVASKSLIDAAKNPSQPVRYILESRLDGAKWTVKLLSPDSSRMPRWGASIELAPNSLQVAK